MTTTTMQPPDRLALVGCTSPGCGRVIAVRGAQAAAQALARTVGWQQAPQGWVCFAHALGVVGVAS